MVALRLSPEIESRLDDLARLTGRSKDALAAEAITALLDDIEDAHLARERLDALDAGRSDTIPLAQLMQRYGVDD